MHPPLSSQKVNLQMQGITVRYGSFIANDGVNISVDHGQTLALLGENGAGKTTLMKVLAGIIKPESGRIQINGKEVQILSPIHSQQLGIGMVHQHFMLIPTLSVAKNVCIGLKSAGYPFPNILKVENELIKISEKYNLQIDPKEIVSTLSVGTQQRVEILKALYRGAKILILDEPTSILTPQETHGLFGIIKFLTGQGCSVIFISHKLNEVMEISDRITVLRQGKVTAEISKDETNEKDLAILMVGHEFTKKRTIKPVPPEASELVKIDRITYFDERKLPVLRELDLTVKKGEIHGIAGVDGNGQVELAKVLAGILRPDSGRIFINGNDVTKLSPGKRITAGLAHIPGDRQRLGLVMDVSLGENFILETSGKEPVSKHGVLNFNNIRNTSKQLIKDYDIRCISVDQTAATLSGGNQQKLVLAREFSRMPKFIIAMQPSRGLDVGATEFVHEKLLEQRENGNGILLISTELDEIFELSDRISVIYEGKILATLSREVANRERIGLLMTGKTDV